MRRAEARGAERESREREREQREAQLHNGIGGLLQEVE